MDELNAIAEYLPSRAANELKILGMRHAIINIRLRVGRPIQVQWHEGNAEMGEAMTGVCLSDTVSAMLQHSMYAWEDELGNGYFTLSNGSRAGVTGNFCAERGVVHLTNIGSVCVRVARSVPGCAKEIVREMLAEGQPESTILLSPPGMGKTTLLRDSARMLSDKGFFVAIADERGEIAACRNGKPSLDVGIHTDVADGIPKALAMQRLIRTMSPDVLITDEIGGEEDARAVRDAVRMGVCVMASAHARHFADACFRPSLKRLLTDGSFPKAFVLGGAPGQIAEKHSCLENSR